jgi:hypothetical protein
VYVRHSVLVTRRFKSALGMFCWNSFHRLSREDRIFVLCERGSAKRQSTNNTAAIASIQES